MRRRILDSDIEVLHMTHPAHSSPGRGDLVAQTEATFTEAIQTELDKRSTEGKQLVAVSDYRGNLRLFFARKVE